MKNKKLYCIEVRDGQQTQTYKFGYDWRSNLMNVLTHCEAAKNNMEFRVREEEVQLLPPQIPT